MERIPTDTSTEEQQEDINSVTTPHFNESLKDEFIPHAGESSTSNLRTPKLLRSAKKRKLIEITPTMVDESTQTRWHSKYDWKIRNVRKESTGKRAGYSKEIDEDILATIVQLMAEADLSTRQAIRAVQIVSNKLFGQKFTLPNDMEQIPEHMLESAPTHNISSEKVFGEVGNRLKHAGVHSFTAISEKIVIEHSKDLLFNDTQWKKPELKKMKKETDELKIVWNASQKEIRATSINTTNIDAEKILQYRKSLKLKDDLQVKYGIVPTTYEGIRQIMQKVNPNEKAKVLGVLVKIAKFDFKSLKVNHPLFKQRGLSQHTLLSNLKVLYCQKSKEVTATIDDIRAVISGSETLDSAAKSTEETSLSSESVPETELVATVWDEEWSLGQVINQVNEDTYKIKYMKRANKDSNLYWLWPVEDKVYDTKAEQILVLRPIIDISDVSSTRTIIFELANHSLIHNLADDY